MCTSAGVAIALNHIMFLLQACVVSMQRISFCKPGVDPQALVSSALLF